VEEEPTETGIGGVNIDFKGDDAVQTRSSLSQEWRRQTKPGCIGFRLCLCSVSV